MSTRDCQEDRVPETVLGLTVLSVAMASPPEARGALASPGDCWQAWGCSPPFAACLVGSGPRPPSATGCLRAAWAKAGSGCRIPGRGAAGEAGPHPRHSHACWSWFRGSSTTEATSTTSLWRSGTRCQDLLALRGHERDQRLGIARANGGMA